MSTNDLSNNVTLQLQLGDNTSDNGQDVNNVNNEQITSNLQNVFASISDTAVSVVEVNNSDSNSATIFEEKNGDDDDNKSDITSDIPKSNGSLFLANTDDKNSWFVQKQYIIFSNQLAGLRRNNIFVLKECKENKRLLDLKYGDLNDNVNNIQTSVIFFSTISGFMQATRIQFGINDLIISVLSITISTYITLLLSISKYYKLDELREQIQNLRSKYSILHNKIEYRMDVLGPWNSKNLWIHADAENKMKEWKKIHEYMEKDYNELIQTKQELCSEFEIIMDTKSRNKYFIKNKELNYNNREKIHNWNKKENSLEQRIINDISKPVRKSSIILQHEELDNWDDDGSVV